MRHRSFSASADLSAAMPAHDGARFDRLEAAIASLNAEQRRLERLGLWEALADCRRQLRYWEFVRAILGLAAAPDALQRRRP